MTLIALGELGKVLYLLFIPVAIGLIANGLFLWKWTYHADQGARGEEESAQEVRYLEEKDLSFVTPIVAFSNATVLVPPGKLQRVYVVEKDSLVSLLKSLG